MKAQSSRNGLIRLALASVIGLMFVMGTGAPAWADLEDVLLEKGTITKEDWLRIKADKEKAQAKQEKSMGYATDSKDKSSSIMKGVDIGVTVYLDATSNTGTSYTGAPQNGVSNSTANNNKSLADGFHFTRTYLNVRKYFDNGDQIRMTLDQMVDNIGGKSCSGQGNNTGGGGVCNEAAPYGLSGFSGNGRNSTFIKYAFYDHNFLDSQPEALHVRFGQHQTPWIEYEEHRWTYRYLFPTMIDQQNADTSSDLGVSLMGKLLDKRVDYHLAFQEGEGYQTSPDSRGFAWRGRLSVEPIPGVIVSAYGTDERNRAGIEGFNPQRYLGNVEFYDPTNDRFKVQGQFLWADDGTDMGAKGRGVTAVNVPGVYNPNGGFGPNDTPVTLGGTAGPTTGGPRFKNGQGYESWAWYRIPGFEKVRIHGRYYFMKPNKYTEAGDMQNYYVGLSYDYSKSLSISLDYTFLNQTVLGSNPGPPGQAIATSGVCATCGQYVNYNNQIFGIHALVQF